MHPRASTIHAQRFFASAHHLPGHLQVLIRLTSTTAPGPGFSVDPGGAKEKNPFPFPAHPRPTPHQIFHLPMGASQADIKARYYDLVRLHHPDSHHTYPLPSAERHARFQSISAAYEVLRRGSLRTYPGQGNFDPYIHELDRRKRAYYATHNRRAEYESARGKWKEEEKPTEEMLWREKMILLFGVLSLAAGLYPSLFLGSLYMDKTHRAAASNLSQARKEAREMGEIRREKVKERVREYRRQEGDGCREKARGGGGGGGGVDKSLMAAPGGVGAEVGGGTVIGAGAAVVGRAGGEGVVVGEKWRAEGAGAQLVGQTAEPEAYVEPTEAEAHAGAVEPGLPADQPPITQPELSA